MFGFCCLVSQFSKKISVKHHSDLATHNILKGSWKFSKDILTMRFPVFSLQVPCITSFIWRVFVKKNHHQSNIKLRQFRYLWQNFSQLIPTKWAFAMTNAQLEYFGSNEKHRLFQCERVWESELMTSFIRYYLMDELIIRLKRFMNDPFLFPLSLISQIPLFRNLRFFFLLSNTSKFKFN